MLDKHASVEILIVVKLYQGHTPISLSQAQPALIHLLSHWRFILSTITTTTVTLHLPTTKMFTNLVLLPFALLTTLTTATTETFKSRTLHPELNAALRTAATAFDRAALLPNAADWTYDFSKHPNFDSPTGAVINADAATFPAVTGLGSSVALLKLAPCGMLPPHLHPRATNIVTAITGNTTTYMIGENGVGVRTVNLLPMMVTVFPQASLHMMQNNGMFSFFSFFFRPCVFFTVQTR